MRATKPDSLPLANFLDFYSAGADLFIGDAPHPRV
jgi:hypothetical protein